MKKFKDLNEKILNNQETTADDQNKFKDFCESLNKEINMYPELDGAINIIPCTLKNVKDGKSNKLSFHTTKSVYNIELVGKMLKLLKFKKRIFKKNYYETVCEQKIDEVLTEEFTITHFMGMLLNLN